MERLTIDSLSPAQLARLLDLEKLPSWHSGDAAAALRHQLAAPIFPDLASVPGIDVSSLLCISEKVKRIPTFLESLTSTDPIVEVLQMIKQFGRHMRDEVISPLCGPPATVLYYAAIASAICGCKERISRLDNEALRKGFKWSAELPGAEELSHIFARASRQLEPPI